jgi:hypothetical protein
VSTVADVIAAIDAEGSTSWAIADQVAALDDIDASGQKVTLEMVSSQIYVERGVEWTTSTLSKYRVTAIAFPPDASVRTEHPFTVCLELRAHPDKLRKWKPKKPGDILTQQRARALRGGSSASQPANSTSAKLKRIVGQLETLVDDEPELVIDTIEALAVEWRRKYTKRIDKERRRGLTAVS